ncbi:MAG: flagellar motor protein MotB [Acidobacteria bacterium]|nr:flagellar motor protein MotB [Acidobacteriota bacterium]
MADQRPIIIIKKKGGHGGHHGGAWKVAYADFVTAMMALFIVLWLMNSSKQVQEAVGGYFKDPTGEARKVGTDESGSGDNFVLTMDNIEDLKQQLQKSIREAPNFELLKDQISMSITDDGLRIELMESATGTFFASGNAVLSEDSGEILSRLSTELGILPNQLYIEGHTDAKSYSEGSSYTNWELSVDRANSARRYMQSHGIQPKQVAQVRGFADGQLRKPDAPLDPSNRRISVIVRFNETPAGSTPPDEATGAAAGHAEPSHAAAPAPSAKH